MFSYLVFSYDLYIVFFNLLYLGIRAAYQSWLTYFPKAGKCEMN